MPIKIKIDDGFVEYVYLLPLDDNSIDDIISSICSCFSLDRDAIQGEISRYWDGNLEPKF